ncbi:MAG TPA: hypothetical protein ENN79_05870 [Desulfobacteraceae bacterium]|nr:hypothetical protein [Desulfobacteraceae bacterium]
MNYKTNCKFIILALLFFLIPVSAVWPSAAANGFAAISIDGDISDWAGMTPAFRDRVNDQNAAADFDGTDIEEVYLAKDDAYLYIMMKIYGHDPKMDMDVIYVFQANQSSQSADTPGDRWTAARYNPFTGWSVSVRERGNPDEIAHYDNSYVGVGERCIEWKIPLSDIGDMTDCFLRVYTHVIQQPQNYPVSDENITNIPILFDEDGIFIGVGHPQLQWVNLRHQTYENGSELNRLYMTLMDEARTQITEDLSPSVELFDPSGRQVALTPMMSTPWSDYSYIFGRYEANTGKWIYDPYFSSDPSYSFNFNDTLFAGNYRLVLTISGYPTAEFYIYYRGQVDLPVFSAASFKAEIDTFGNLVWRWDVPDFLNPDISTSNRASIGALFQGVPTRKLLYVTVPTQMGFAFVPKNVLDMFMDEGETLTLELNLRENNNVSRSYSNRIPLEAASGPPLCDVDGDGLTGLSEAVYALQAASGMRPTGE